MSSNVISAARNNNRNLLEHEAMELLKQYSITTPDCRLVTSTEEAIKAAKEIHYPVVLKIVSKDIIHKSDVGCVKVGIANEEELQNAYAEIMSNGKKHVPDADVTGVLLVEMVKGGVECIVGMTRDEQFGPTILFGLGGIFVELLKDVSLEILPISQEEAAAMIRKIKGFPLLSGYRGSEKKDLKAMENLLLALSRLVMENPEIKEIDLNPVLAFETGVKVLDARVLL